MSGFVLDPRLASDSLPVTRLTLCEVRLMDDERFPWLVLVPQLPDLAEVLDLPDQQQVLLWQEVGAAAAALRAVTPCDKLNIGALGNIVRQLHVHIVARNVLDSAWPGPVWGKGVAKPYPEDSRHGLITQLQQACGHRR